MNENIKPIMKQYGEKLKEHGHDYKIDVKSNSIEMQILPDIVKRESYSLGSDDKNAHIGFYFKEGEIRVSSLTIVPAVSSGSGGVRKTFKDIDEISDKEINIILTNVITEIFDNCKMAIGWR
ncbi:MAG: hypothetical protein U5N56_00245 [Candidatus Marinimicrobia bacterium]|nr:hypothetical protein [Candidatus Neomarinimicrobiota bacterium]